MIQLKVNGSVIAILVPDLVNMVINGLLNAGLSPQNGFVIEATPLKLKEKTDDNKTAKKATKKETAQ